MGLSGGKECATDSVKQLPSGLLEARKWQSRPIPENICKQKVTLATALDNIEEETKRAFEA